MVILHVKLKGVTKYSNMLANSLRAEPPHHPSDQNSTFSEHDHDAYQNKWNDEIQQHGSTYFTCRPPPPTLGSKLNISEQCHVAYKI